MLMSMLILSQKIALDEESGHTEHNHGSATRLYLLSREGLQRLCRSRQITSWPSSRLTTLKEELGKL